MLRKLFTGAKFYLDGSSEKHLIKRVLEQKSSRLQREERRHDEAAVFERAEPTKYSRLLHGVDDEDKTATGR